MAFFCYRSRDVFKMVIGYRKSYTSELLIKLFLRVSHYSLLNLKCFALLTLYIFFFFLHFRFLDSIENYKISSSEGLYSHSNMTAYSSFTLDTHFFNNFSFAPLKQFCLFPLFSFYLVYYNLVTFLVSSSVLD